MKRSWVLFVWIAASLFWQSWAAATDWTTATIDRVVVCRGNPLHDVPALQAAVDPGGTVLIRGLCRLGNDTNGFTVDPIPCDSGADCLYGSYCEDGYCFFDDADGARYLANPDPYRHGDSTVYITASTTILGEVNRFGRPLTRIVGGEPPFMVGWDGDITLGGFPAPPDPSYEHWGVDLTARYGPRWCRAYPEIDVTIANLQFEGPSGTAVGVGAARDFVFENNVVSNVRSGFYDAWFANGAVQRAVGVGVGGAMRPPFLHMQDFFVSGPTMDTNQPTGYVGILNNRISSVGEDEADVSLAWYEDTALAGIYTEFTNAELEIAGNTIRGIGYRTDMNGSTGIAILDNFGTTSVHHNRIGYVSRRGIADLAAFTSIYLPAQRAVISQNTIYQVETGITSNSSDEGQYLGNTILLTDAFACIELYGSDYDTIRANTCSGTAQYVFYLDGSTNNTFTSNRFSTFRPTVAHVGLYDGSNDNVFTGQRGSYVEEDSTGNILWTQP